jgi:hypothetical protein
MREQQKATSVSKFIKNLSLTILFSRDARSTNTTIDSKMHKPLTQLIPRSDSKTMHQTDVIEHVKVLVQSLFVLQSLR